MSRRITYHHQGTTIDPVTSPRPQSELTGKLHAAIAAGIALFIISLVFTTFIASLVWPLTVEVAGIVALVCFVLSLLFTAGLVLKWSLTVAERPWWLERTARDRRWRLEDEDRERAAALVGKATESALSPGKPDLSYVGPLALELLRRHYAGKSTSRKACEKAGICSQARWNLVNEVFKAAGMKAGYKLEPGDSLEAAWLAWGERVQVRDGQVWVRRGRGQWHIINPNQKAGR